MAVYVDNARKRLGRMIMCHLVADTPAELHAMADRLGLRRDWYHDGHYNCSLVKRAKAIAAGAICITQRQAVPLRLALLDFDEAHAARRA